MKTCRNNFKFMFLWLLLLIIFSPLCHIKMPYHISWNTHTRLFVWIKSLPLHISLDPKCISLIKQLFKKTLTRRHTTDIQHEMCLTENVAYIFIHKYHLLHFINKEKCKWVIINLFSLVLQPTFIHLMTNCEIFIY